MSKFKFEGTDTAYGIPFNKALGMQLSPQKRLYEDPFSEKLLSLPVKLIIQILKIPVLHRWLINYYEKNYPGMLGYLFCRFAYYDDAIKKYIRNDDFDYAINLGAGMDARAYYMPELQNIRYVEIDHPSVIKRKKEKLITILGELPNHITFIEADFELDDISEKLLDADINPNRKIYYQWESVSAYLTDTANQNIFSLFSKSAAGSKFVFSYVTDDFFEGKMEHPTLKMLYERAIIKKQLALKSSFDKNQMATLLKNHNIKIVEHVGAEALKQIYNTDQHLNMDVCEVERIIMAEKKRD